MKKEKREREKMVERKMIMPSRNVTRGRKRQTDFLERDPLFFLPDEEMEKIF
jgi:hypothetical protein